MLMHTHMHSQECVHLRQTLMRAGLGLTTSTSVPLASMTTEEGTKPPTVRLVPLLVANLTMILFGITAGLTTSGAKWFIFGGALCFGGVVFSSAIQVMTIDLALVRSSPLQPCCFTRITPFSPLYRPQCLIALISSSPTAAVRTSSIWLAVTFLCGWGIFPLTFLTGD